MTLGPRRPSVGRIENVARSEANRILEERVEQRLVRKRVVSGGKRGTGGATPSPSRTSRRSDPMAATRAPRQAPASPAAVPPRARYPRQPQHRGVAQGRVGARQIERAVAAQRELDVAHRAERHADQQTECSPCGRTKAWTTTEAGISCAETVPASRSSGSKRSARRRKQGSAVRSILRAFGGALYTAA